MSERQWMQSDRNLADQPIESFADLSDEERGNLALLVRQCRGWSSQNIDEVIAPMAEESIRKALLINQGDWMAAFFHSPLAIGLCTATIVLTFIAVRLGVGERINVMAENEEKEAPPPKE